MFQQFTDIPYPVDDDGSGTVNLIDIIRVLAQSGYKPATPLEFHFYGGEELGLLGSGDIATSYRSAGKSVKGVLQLDMTALYVISFTGVFSQLTLCCVC